MKILVPVKRVPDYGSKVKPNQNGTWIVEDGIKWIANPFDEIAVEEALRLKEQGSVSEIVVVTIGPKEAETQLRHAMAMGADRAILVEAEFWIDSDLAARVLAAVVKREEPRMVIMGKQAVDSDANQAAQNLAQRLNWGQACFASKLTLGDGSCTVVREVDGGLETLKVSLPCVVSTDLRLNEPRYASLPGIMKAKKKPLEMLPIAGLGLSDIQPKVAIKRLVPPPQRSAGRTVASVAELVELLQREAKVI